MKKVLLSMIAAVFTVLGLTSVAGMSPAYALKTICPDGTAVDGTLADCTGNGVSAENNEDSLMTTLNTTINVIVGVVGFVAVVMIIIGGINFVISQGDTGKVAKARNTILYGVIGLVVAMLAFAIVNFVLGNIF